MNTTQTESLDAIVSQFASRIAKVIVARTLEQLFAGQLGTIPQQLSLSHEITNPADVLGGTMPTRKRLRRSGESVDRDVTKIVAALLSKPGGMRADELRQTTGLGKPEMLLPLRRALETGQVTKTGQKRATLYRASGKPATTEGDSIPAKAFVGKVIRRKGKKS